MTALTTPTRPPDPTTRTTAAGALATKHAAEPRTLRPITNPNDTPTPAPFPAAAVCPIARRTGAAKLCPSCRTPLDGGPVRFRCEPCGKCVMAADLDTEYHAPGPRTGERAGRAAA